MPESAVVLLERACERLFNAVADGDWTAVREIDDERCRLIDRIEQMKSRETDPETAARLRHILKLDSEIQPMVLAAWQQARDNLLSLEKGRSAIDLYRQQ